jgi:hypothetical protein
VALYDHKKYTSRDGEVIEVKVFSWNTEIVIDGVLAFGNVVDVKVQNHILWFSTASQHYGFHLTGDRPTLVL